jgi:arylsulfatase A-like enzyme
MKSPNILVINVDQQRYDCLGFTGNPLTRTPFLDELAAGGMQCTSAFTPAPLCCPARQTFLSGVMPEVHGGLWNYDSGNPIPGLDPSRATWINTLRSLGYRTAYIGKWHVNRDVDPTGFGFESHEGRGECPQCPDGIEPRYPIEEPGRTFSIGHIDRTPLERSHTHQLAQRTIDSIERFRASGQPWHIRLDFPQPHLPCLPAEPFASLVKPDEIPPWDNFEDSFDGKPHIQRWMPEYWGTDRWTWNQWSVFLAGYYGIIAQVDDAIGRVMRYLEEKGLMRDTLLIYTTDHGESGGAHHMMDKHYHMYEETVKVPLVLRWDGVIAPGSVCDDFLVHYLDLPVTLLDLLGVEAPAEYAGLSFLPQLRGEKPRSTRDCVFASYNGQQFGLFTQRMIRDREFKFVWNATDVDELYDLGNDPGELVNLATRDEYAQTVTTYRRRMAETFEALGDAMVQNAWTRHHLLGEGD